MTTSTALKSYGPQQALDSGNFIRQNAEGLGLKPAELNLHISAVLPGMKAATGTTTLVRTTKKYIVPFNGRFYSYPLVLVVHPTSSSLYKMQAPIPNILREGMVVVDGEVYAVKLEDLKRGIVRKSRQLPIPPKRTITYKDFIDGLACTQTADLPDDHYYSTRSVAERRAILDAAAGGDTTTAIDVGEDGTPENQLALGAEIAVDLDEESRLADLAYQEQVGALYGDSTEEENWEDEVDSQS